MDLSAFVSVTSLLLWAAAFLYFRSYLKRRTGADRLLSEFREEVEKLVSEIDAATDRDATLVEERVRSLRALLEDADRRISAYAREIDRRGSEERAYAELGRRARPFRGTDAESAPSAGPADPSPPVRKETPVQRALDSRAVDQRPVDQRVETQAELSIEPRLESPEGLRAEADQQPAPGPRFVRSEIPIEPKPAPFAERVAELYRAGFSADLIAKRLGATVAEVDLAIALTGRVE